MPADQYILSFNFSEISNQVSTVQGAYTELGRAIKSSTNDLISEFSTLTSQVEAFQDAFIQASSITNSQYLSFLQNASQTAKLFESFAKDSKSIARSFDKIKGFDFRNLGKEGSVERIEAVIPGASVGLPGVGSREALRAVEEAKKAAAEAIKIAKQARDGVKVTGEQAKEQAKGINVYIAKEMKTARRSMASLAGRAIPGGIVGGGLIGGMLASIIMGVSEQQRTKKERGEMLNTLEAVGNIFSKQGEKAVGWLSSFQERAQRYYGITKEQTQAVVGSMVESGYKVSEMLSKVSDRTGDVNENVTTLSMGLDAYFGLASGRAISGMTELVVEYGDSLKTAANKYVDLMFAAQSSGMGVSRFIDSVRGGSQALTQYGIDVKDVAASLLSVKKHYEDLGLTSQAAGTWAGKGLQSVAQGLSNVSDINVMVMMRRHPDMGYYEAKQALQEGWLEKDKAKRYGEQIKGIIEFLTEKVGPNEAKQKEFLSQQPGWSYLGASTLMSLKDNIDNQGKLVGATESQLKELDKAFKVQGKTLSELQKVQYKLIDSIAKIGQGLLQVVTGIFGTVVTGFASIPMLIKALTLTGKDREDALQSIVDINNKQLSNVVSGFEKSTSGAKMLAKVLGDEYKNIFPNFDELKKVQDAINKSAPQTLAEAGVQVVASAVGVEQPRVFAEEFEKQAQKTFDPLYRGVGWLMEDVKHVPDLIDRAIGEGLDKKYEYHVDRLKKSGGLMGDVQSDELDYYPTAREKVSRDKRTLPNFDQTPSIPIPRPTSDASKSEPVPAQAPSNPVYKGPSSVSSPKIVLPAFVIHNSVTNLQSTLAGEVSR